jgi:CelD/BcsL family acetyltransferase involved in cellulose biosynthesis
MEHAAREGVVCVDMLRGHEDYKHAWHPEQAPTYGCEIKAADWRSIAQGVAA